MFETIDVPRDSLRKLFVMGLVTKQLNPKVAILYLALIPQFIDPHRGHVVAQGFQLGAIQSAVGVTVNGMIVLGAGNVATRLRRRPAWLRRQKWATDTLLGAIKIKLAFDAPTPASSV